MRFLQEVSHQGFSCFLFGKEGGIPQMWRAEEERPESCKDSDGNPCFGVRGEKGFSTVLHIRLRMMNQER